MLRAKTSLGSPRAVRPEDHEEYGACRRLHRALCVPRRARWRLGVGCGGGLLRGGGVHLRHHQEPGGLPGGPDGGVRGEQQPRLLGHLHLRLRLQLLRSVLLTPMPMTVIHIHIHTHITLLSNAVTIQLKGVILHHQV